jgi:hypothetical protein
MKMTFVEWLCRLSWRQAAAQHFGSYEAAGAYHLWVPWTAYGDRMSPDRNPPTPPV